MEVRMRFRLIVDGEAHEVEVDGEPPGLTVRVDGAAYRTTAVRDGTELTVRIGARRHRIRIHGRQVLVDGLTHEVATEALDVAGRPSAGAEGARSGGVFEVRPPMPGRVVRLAAAAGDRVKRGQTVAVLEAMKMQNDIPAPTDGVVKSVGVREGESISADRVIAVLEAR
jgi:biotin carboxyl carrier protein